MKAVLLSAVLLGITIATSSHADQQTGPRRHDSITAEPPEEQEREAGEKHGGYRLICKTQIKALEGDAVVLPSILYPPLNLTTRTLDVRRRDLRPPDHDVVHSYRDGGDHLAPQMIRYRNRTSLSHSQLTGGILELQISSVNPSDSGPYTFYVSKPVKASCVTNLTVGGYRLICKTQIKALEGDPVVLQSILYPPLNLTTRTLDVRRRDLRPPDDDVVHSYRDGGDHLAPQMIRYRNRTSLSHSQLTGGILELQISSVNPSDSGPYTFYVSKPVKASCVTNLTVVSTDQQTRPRRHDSITTKPPEEREPGPGEKHGADWKHVVSGVVGGVAVAVGVVVLLLRKLGVICMKEDRVI